MTFRPATAANLNGKPATASTVTLPPVLDFDVTPVGRSFRWTVFDARTASGLMNFGNASTVTAAVIAAMGAIADRTPGRIYALQTNRSWVVRVHGMWAPLPLTPAATEADVFAYCTDIIAKGRSVEVVNVARLAAAAV